MIVTLISTTLPMAAAVAKLIGKCVQYNNHVPFHYGPPTMSQIETEYQSRMDALTGKERVARSLALLQWSREMIARQITAEKGAMSAERLKWEVALRLYGADDEIRQMIENKITDVSD